MGADGYNLQAEGTTAFASGPGRLIGYNESAAEPTLNRRGTENVCPVLGEVGASSPSCGIAYSPSQSLTG
jgi:hypothetical protein